MLYNYYNIHDTYENKVFLLKNFIEWLRDKSVNMKFPLLREYEIDYSDKIVKDIINNKLHKVCTDIKPYILYSYFYHYIYNNDFEYLRKELEVDKYVMYWEMFAACLERSTARIMKKHVLVDHMVNYELYDSSEMCGIRIKPPNESYTDDMIYEGCQDFISNIDSFIKCYKDSIIINVNNFLADIIMEVTNYYHSFNYSYVWCDILALIIEDVNGTYGTEFTTNDYL